MRSFSAFANLSGDPAGTANELFSQLSPEALSEKNGVALAFCDPDETLTKTLSELSELLPYPLLGCTSIGLFHALYGFDRPGVALTVLAADDCYFKIGLSNPLTAGNADAELKEMYEAAKSTTRFRAKAIFAFACHNPDVPVGRVCAAIADAAGDEAPVFGGMPSPNGVYGPAGIFYDYQFHADRAAVLIITGNCKPVYAVRQAMHYPSGRKGTVTKAEGNRVYRVGDAAFTDYLKECGLIFSKADLKNQPFFFNANPVAVENHATKKIHIQTLLNVDQKTGAGILADCAPEGSFVSIGVLRKKDIDESERAALDAVFAQITENEKDGYEYSSVFYLSSVCRYFAALPKNQQNLKNLFGTVPTKLVLNGFYGWGLFCPVPDKKGRNENAAHSAAVALMAI